MNNQIHPTFFSYTGKSTVCILHEYLQHSIKKAPDYDYQELESSATPYSAVVKINGIEYGRGVGSSKKEAKSEAARKTLEIFIPEFKKYLTAKNGYVTKESHDLSVSSLNVKTSYIFQFQKVIFHKFEICYPFKPINNHKKLQL